MRGLFKRVLFLAMLLFLGCGTTVWAREFSLEEREALEALVVPSPVIALFEGEDVEILQDVSEEWYYVRHCVTDQKHWARAQHLIIPSDPPTLDIPMAKQQLEDYVNMMEFASATKYFVWTDISRQKTYVFMGSKGNWALNRVIVCSTGKNHSPTKRGMFTLQERGDWFYSERLKSGAKFWVRFHGTYLYHSHCMDRNQVLMEQVVGIRQSSGCVRMSVEDARWFYNTVAEGSAVFIY